MSYLLDTNILSETVKTAPNTNVLSWIESIPDESLFISVLTLGEIRRGIEKLDEGKKKRHLLVWLETDLQYWFSDRVLPVNYSVADRWGFVSAHMEKDKTSSAIDTLIAATALTHNLKMATRNVRDFDIPGLEVINPFD
ncbi:MAG: type II toxin-antitoxin system VapC family toxin [Alphaproteobacteria bacterium]|jgi:predicted nucleic acid-binding protein